MNIPKPFTKQITYTLDEVEEVAQTLAELTASYPVLTFVGPLGAGKTTLIRSLVRALGSQIPVTSPTFAYVNIYRLPSKRSIYHFDLYRIESPDQFAQMGFDEYLNDPDGLALIEWPEVIQPLLGLHCAISIGYHDDPERRVAQIVCSEVKD